MTESRADHAETTDVNQDYTLFTTCPKGVEDLLAAECEQQGGNDISAAYGGVNSTGSIENAYRLCLWSRVASRVLLKLKSFPVNDHDDLYHGVQAIDWSTHLDHDGSFAIDVHTTHPQINNSHFATLKVKDAIADQFVQEFGSRPDVQRNRPDIRVNTYLDKQSCTVYLDLSGEPLHKRGYRQQAGLAPLKENLAAAILLRAHWPQQAAENRPLIDPLCGSATLLLEAAYIAAGMAPGLLRDYFGFLRWKQHDAAAWARLINAAKAAVDKSRVPMLIGIEKSFKVAGIARDNIEAAGFADAIEIRQADSVDVITDLPPVTGMIVTNPPYGKRIGETGELKSLYYELGKKIKQRFPGWDVALFTASHELAKFFGLRAHHKNTLYNGPLKCTLYQYHIREARLPSKQDDLSDRSPVVSEDAEMLANRLVKNLKHLSRWLRKDDISCYRIYDADIPQYAIAVDVYEDWVHVQEYEPPQSVDAVKAFVRLNDAMKVISRVLDVDNKHIILKTRKKQSGAEQYTRQDVAGEKVIAHEYGLKFKLNLKDYLDTGLFPDHRLTRKLIAAISAGKSFLNLFAYTGTATVYAAAGGASSTTTVDMSNTYLAWARENLKLNGLDGKQHVFIREDCLAWMADAENQGKRYQLIFLDPPTFSNSKRMERTLDIKRDHVELIQQAVALLDDDGLLIFSSNARGFKLDEKSLGEYSLRDITRMTTPEDFRRKPAHVCWCIARHADVLKNCRL
ncbi:MAG: bifunctional 23S rRNA (guanine(2069)-N(7))-methyltransferase RlmK/23S rRNA (guanine(2445)-N(2))-methyltransferase RlmL [Gammaproteobacteria bacterium]|jgi:23S rRNA (guanine2445-N2)-methyltransferase / 23S rRNA (guanine2069-N7)-methyltransferase